VRDGLIDLSKTYEAEELVLLTICPTFEARCRSYELLAEAFDLSPSENRARAAV
jgi:hypothetical protein